MKDKEYLAHAIKTVMIPWSGALLIEFSTVDGPDFTTVAITIGVGVVLAGWITVKYMRLKRKQEHSQPG